MIQPKWTSKYKVFISYEETTGLDLAYHLKKALEKRSICSFVADRDLPKSVTAATEWQALVDDVINAVNTFILILSGPSLSPEVVRETILALRRSQIDTRFSIIICRHTTVPRAPEQLAAAGIDASKFQQVDFDTKEELAREVNPIIDNQGSAQPSAAEYPPFQPSKPLTPRQLGYRAEVRADLLRIEQELCNIKQPRLIQFESWNAFIQPDSRPADIHNDHQYEAIQNLSTVLNKRNKYVNNKIIQGNEDLEFQILNAKCLEMYEKIRETGFLDVNLQLRKIEESKVPKIVVTPAKIDSQKFKAIHVRLQDGTEKIQARFYFITVKNVSGPTINDLEAYFKATYFKTAEGGALISKGPFPMIMSTAADHMTLYYEGFSIEEFRKREASPLNDDLRIELLRTNDGKLVSRKLTLHEGGIGKTFGLFFTLEGYRVLTIPCYSTRASVPMPCSFRIDLYLQGDAFPSKCVASFQVEADDWDSFEVKPVESLKPDEVSIGETSAIRLRETEDVTVEDIKAEGYDHIVDDAKGKRTKIRNIDDEIPKPIGIKFENARNCLVDNGVFQGIPTPILDIGGKGNVYRRIRAY